MDLCPNYGLDTRKYSAWSFLSKASVAMMINNHTRLSITMTACDMHKTAVYAGTGPFIEEYRIMLGMRQDSGSIFNTRNDITTSVAPCPQELWDFAVRSTWFYQCPRVGDSYLKGCCIV